MTSPRHSRRWALVGIVLSVAIVIVVVVALSAVIRPSPFDPHPAPTTFSECNDQWGSTSDVSFPGANDWSEESHPLGSGGRAYVCYGGSGALPLEMTVSTDTEGISATPTIFAITRSATVYPIDVVATRLPASGARIMVTCRTFTTYLNIAPTDDGGWRFSASAP